MEERGEGGAKRQWTGRRDGGHRLDKMARQIRERMLATFPSDEKMASFCHEMFICPIIQSAIHRARPCPLDVEAVRSRSSKVSPSFKVQLNQCPKSFYWKCQELIFSILSKSLASSLFHLIWWFIKPRTAYLSNAFDVRSIRTFIFLDLSVIIQFGFKE